MELHKSDRVGWLRAAVLGANDGTISIASLLVGVAAGGALNQNILLMGVAGVAAGAMSMAAGEYVSVQSQADTENADITREKDELLKEPERELIELTAIYINRGLDEPLAKQVAEKLMSIDAIGTHAREELGITEAFRAKPIQAALVSACSFTLGAIIPFIAALLAPPNLIVEIVSITALITLGILGATAAYVGGASKVRGTLRVVFWGALAMSITAVVGKLFGGFI